MKIDRIIDQAKFRVIQYYEKSVSDYSLIYFRQENYSMNYGYWDNSVKNRNQSLLRLYEKINDELKLSSQDKILDAGCGFGEASCWFAKYTGCSVTGITITPFQVGKATQIARERGLSKRINYCEMDYTKTSFKPNSFDAIIAIETICHLIDKNDFYKEAFRILKPEGKLIVAEYTLVRQPETIKEKYSFNKFLRGWEIPNLWFVKQHMDAMEQIGFLKVVNENYSDKTIRISKFLYNYSVIGLPIYWLLNKLMILNDVRLNDAVACRYQWITKNKNLWGHTLFKAKKNKI